MELKIVTYNIEDIWSSNKDWCNNRWGEIYSEILNKDPDIIILHEINLDSELIFDKFTDNGYEIYVPYDSRDNKNYQRNNWEKFYSKIKPHKFGYEIISPDSGISSVVLSFRVHDSDFVVKICAITESILCEKKIGIIKSALSFDLDERLIISLSTTETKCPVRTPKGYKNLLKRYSVNNDFLWHRNIFLENGKPLGSDYNSYHRGLYFSCFLLDFVNNRKKMINHSTQCLINDKNNVKLFTSPSVSNLSENQRNKNYDCRIEDFSFPGKRKYSLSSIRSYNKQYIHEKNKVIPQEIKSKKDANCIIM